MSLLPAFHLSLSVGDLERTERFYVSVLGASVGRRAEGWIDIWLYGAQVTAYRRPAAVVPMPQRDAMHFGATLEWSQWHAFAERLAATDVPFRLPATVDEEKGQAKLMLADPDGYLIEIKAYRLPETSLQPA